MPKRRAAPPQSRKTFLSNHVGQLVSIDFFTVPKVQLRVFFVFVVLAHERRRVLHLNVTERPTAEWTAQQIIEAFPEETAFYTGRYRTTLKQCFRLFSSSSPN